MDIKEIDPDKHKYLTGHDNSNILQLARYLSDNKKDMWIRHVLVLGLTDQERELKLLSEFLDSLDTVKKREILPYHVLGVTKWEKLGIPYTLKDTIPTTEEKIRWAEEVLKIR